MNIYLTRIGLFILLSLAGSSTAQTLVHYWNFNTVTSESAQLTPNVSLVNGASIVHTPGPVPSAINLAGGTGQGYTTGMNERNGDVAGNHLRLDNPAGAILTISLPTTGYQDVVVKCAVRRSSTGAEQEKIEYTTDGVSYTELTTYSLSTTAPEIKTFDFSSITDADGNANFKIRITCIQGTGSTAGNHRFDNLTLDGNSLSGDVTPPTVAFSPLTAATAVWVNTKPTITFNEDVRLVSDLALDNSNVDDVVELRLDDAVGATVPFDATITGNVITITPPSDLNFSQTYYVAVRANTVEDISNNAIAAAVSASFTTTVPQTSFQPGDLVPVAYRMSATATDDGVAFLSLVDILPGTIITFTDGKYTDNAQAQCSGGLVWTAPETGLSSGTVLEFNLATPSVNTGTFTGSSFGLSSAGDQVIVYAGSATSPSYITALSSNAWVTATHTLCSGSASKLPAALADGSSSISFSTVSAAANMANGYYSGIMEGTIPELRTAILDTLNWEFSPLNTAPQTWPLWAFPGPPVVTSAKVISETSIRITFNRDMENVSVTDIANYTGIAGTTSVVRSANGVLADTVVVNYSAAFVNGTSYTLTVDNVLDAEGRMMADPYVFTFVYESIISLDKKFSIGTEGASVTMKLKIENPSACSVNIVLQTSGTAGAADHNFSNVTVNLAANETEKIITIPFNGDTEEEMDEYFIVSVESNAGCSISGTPYFTAYIKDDDRTAPEAAGDITLSFVSRFAVDNPSNAIGLSEIVAYDPVSKRLFTMSTGLERFDIVDFSDPENPELVQEVSVAAYGAGITSVAVKNEIVVVSVTGLTSEQDNGSVLFYDTDGNFLKQLEAGALPDMITFTPDGTKVLTANEGQPSLDYSIDPEGTISIIDISGGVANLNQGHVTTIGFTAFNLNEATYIASGVRKGKQSSTLSQDIEPEYITVSPDSKKAWISLQENNAIAVLNLETYTITDIKPLGTKDFSQFGNGLDVSDKTSEPVIANWPVKGFYMPDGIANISIEGITYLVTANEGDEREYTNLNERAAVSAINLDAAAFPDASILKQDVNLGRFRITNINGDTDTDTDFDELYCVGARSFSIWNATTGAQVFDSGDDFERITAADALTSSIFNTDNTSNNYKERSRAKGPEPEGVTVAKIGDESFAFIGLERIGGVMVYNISDPQNAYFVDYVNSRDNSTFAGDNGPEGIIYLSGDISPDGKYYIITANEVSGTLAVYEIGNIENIITRTDAAEKKSEIKVFPNPCKNGIVNFSVPVTGIVLDAYGRTVALLQNKMHLDLHGHSAGIYTILLQDGNAVKVMME